MAAHQVNITDRAKRQTRQNLFGFGRKPAPVVKPRKGRGGLTLAEAGSAAFKAGKKSRDLSDFDSWMERKHLDDRSDGFVSRVRDDYKRGVARVEADEENKEFLKLKREQSREVARDRKAQARESGKRAAPGASAYPDEATLQAGFKRGLSLADMLRANPAPSKKWGRDIVLYEGDSLETARQYLHRAISGSAYIGLQMFGRKGKWYVTAESVRKGNPAAGAAEVFEEFHGFEPSEVVTVTKHIHHHEHLAAAGKLTHLDVWGVDGKGHHVSGFKGAFLAFNESKDQLFVEGGDQSVNLEDFGIRKTHELETLGRLTDIGYQTNKTHLGDEGGEAVYVHKFRSTNENGKHVVVKIARYPDLIYDVRNEQLLFSGGSYEILREGINK
jgi:hypothetical protein